MDNVTHALAGCLISASALAIVERRHGPTAPGFRVAATIVGIAAAELPDIDLLYAGLLPGMGKLGYLLHHRGYTHTLVFAILGALAVWDIAIITRAELRAPAARNALLGIALAGTLSHLALDYGNSYGIHPFWPLNNSWYYGDSIFIIEPWLWIVSLPALFFAATHKAARAIFAVLLLAILVAAWQVAMVGHAVALALTIGAVVWALIVFRTQPALRVRYAIFAWLAVDAVFGSASVAARRVVRSNMRGATYRDAALTPAVGNPLCFSAQTVSVDGTTLRISRTDIAPFPWLVDVTHCGDATAPDGVTKRARTKSRARSVSFTGDWTARQSELTTLVRNNCEVAAAMRFVRIPEWQFGDSGAVVLDDARFGQTGKSFAAVTSHTPPASCPRFVPDWTPPRSDLLN